MLTMKVELKCQHITSLNNLYIRVIYLKFVKSFFLFLCQFFLRFQFVCGLHNDIQIRNNEWFLEFIYMYTGFYQCSLLNVTVLKTSVGNRHLTLPFISNLSSLTAMSKSSALLGKLSSGPLCNIKNIKFKHS